MKSIAHPRSVNQFVGASIADALSSPLQEGRASALMMQHAGVELRWYAPATNDDQQPHDRDELYFIARGAGWFVRETVRTRFQAGDTIFVAAGQKHRFEEFGPDFGTWVVFFGEPHHVVATSNAAETSGSIAVARRHMPP